MTIRIWLQMVSIRHHLKRCGHVDTKCKLLDGKHTEPEFKEKALQKVRRVGMPEAAQSSSKRLLRNEWIENRGHCNLGVNELDGKESKLGGIHTSWSTDYFESDMADSMWISR